MRKIFMMWFWLIAGHLLSAQVAATVINPVANEWYLFDVDEWVSQDAGTGWIDAQIDKDRGYSGDGSPISFVFSLAVSSVLTVVDAGIAGDMFTVSINGTEHSSSTVNTHSDAFAGADFNEALANPDFSRLRILLSPGVYTVTGWLAHSAVDAEGVAYNATLGGMRIVAVDEPLSAALLAFCIALLSARRLRSRTQHGGFQK